MKLQSRSSSWSQNLFVHILLAGVFALLLCQNVTKADEIPAFFLKIAKNIPRVGRSGRSEDFYFKSAKNNPRIGRRDDEMQPSDSWSSHDNEPFAGPIKRRMDYPAADEPEAWSWQHFPLAIEGPRELWRTLAGYSKDSSDDIDNEVWQRKKRIGNDPAMNSQGN